MPTWHKSPVKSLQQSADGYSAANLKEQNAINTEQAVYNAANNSTIGCLRSHVAALLGMTKMVIPADNVCPKPMPEYNSWTAPT